jgi:hypothetical protein
MLSTFRHFRSRDLIILTVVALWPVDKAQADTAIATNNQNNSIANIGLQLSGGSVSGLARATVFGPPVVLTAGPISKAPVPSGGTTGEATQQGASPAGAAVTVASAQTMWTVTRGSGFLRTVTASPLTIGVKGTFAKVTAGSALGVASTTLTDPWMFTGAAGHLFELAYGLDTGDNASDSFAVEALGPSAQAEVDASAGSNIPGLSSLFSFSMTVSGLDPSHPVINFSSNPLLGLNDTAITNQILSGLTFDPSQGLYSLSSSFNYLDFVVTVPSNQDEVEFSYNTNGNASASLPEPSTFGLLGIAMGTIWLRRSRRPMHCER